MVNDLCGEGNLCRVDFINQLMIYLSFPFVVCHTSLFSESHPQSQSLQIETCTPKVIVQAEYK